MKQYFTGFFTGACLVASAVMFMGASNKNLGDIVVSSIKVLDENGRLVQLLNNAGISMSNSQTKEIGFIIGVNGIMATYNEDGKITTFLGNSDNGSGIFKTYNTDGNVTINLGTGEGDVGILKTKNADGNVTAYLGDGALHTYNKHGKRTVSLGTNTNGDGIIGLHDRYGDQGWSASGKQ